MIDALVRNIDLDHSRPVPLYHQISRRIGSMIQRGVIRPGEQLPGVPRLAGRLGINHQTVRQAYKELLAGRLVSSARGKGTFVSSRQEVNASRTIGIITPGPVCEYDEHQRTLSGILRGIEQELEGLGWERKLLLPKDMSSDEFDRDIDGSIVVAMTTEQATQARVLAPQNHPMIFIGGNEKFTPCIHADDDHAMELLVEYLTALGHHRIAIVVGQLDSFAAQRKFQAYVHYMARQGREISPDWLYFTGYDDPYLEKVQEQQRFFESMLATPQRPTAILSTSSYITMSVLQTLYRNGVQVPKDVSICGFDDWRALAMASPSVTTIAQPLEKIGRIAVRMIGQALDGQDVQSLTMPVEIICRESAGAPPKINDLAGE